MLKPINEIKDELIDLLRNGPAKGYNTNIKPLDELITFVKGGCTDITGYPFGGKSLFLKEIIVSLTINHNWRHAIYMPDDGSEVEIISNIIHKMYGKTFYPNQHNTITEIEIHRYLTEIEHYFRFAKGIQEPKQFWNFARENKCNTAVIDSWNYMSHEGDPTKPDYLRQILSYRNTFMQDNKMHSLIIIHPKNPDPMQIKEGNVKKPTVYHIMGGSEWNNNGKNIIVVHKHEKNNYHEPYLVSIDKIKPKHVGKLGECHLHFDWAKQKFYSMDNYQQTKIFAYGEDEAVNNEVLAFNPIDDEPF